MVLPASPFYLSPQGKVFGMWCKGYLKPFSALWEMIRTLLSSAERRWLHRCLASLCFDWKIQQQKLVSAAILNSVNQFIVKLHFEIGECRTFFDKSLPYSVYVCYDPMTCMCRYVCICGNVRMHVYLDIYLEPSMRACSLMKGWDSRTAFLDLNNFFAPPSTHSITPTSIILASVSFSQRKSYPSYYLKHSTAPNFNWR